MPQYDRLFIAEKSSVGKTFAEYLARSTGKQVQGSNGYVRVGNDVVTWMAGHLLELVDAKDYDPKYEKWKLEDLPILPNPFKLAIKGSRGGGRDATPQVKLIKQLLAECTTVVGYGDPDAEGQLLQDELLHFLGNKKPVLRLWSSSLDDAALGKALASMKPNSDYIGWYESALARSHSDWLYGINMTRACTIQARNAGGDFVARIGRVQTPTLALVVNRELEIRNFKPVNFFVPFLMIDAVPEFRADWTPLKNADGAYLDPRVDIEGRLLNKADAEKIVASAREWRHAKVASVEQTAGTEAAPLPFSLSALQTHCSRLFGFSAKKTLDVAQQLYLKKITTYPRVDSDYLPDAQHADAPRILQSILKASIPEAITAGIRGSKPTLKSKCWNDSKVTAHHAIIPAPLDNPGEIGSLSTDELKVYLEIVKRYVLQFWPPAKFSATKVALHCGGSPSAPEVFTAKGKRYLEEGWRAAFSIVKDEDEEDVPTLPPLEKGMELSVSEASMDARVTKPPKRFTDGTLISAMKHIYQYVKDPEYRKRLQAKEGGGIGTEATRGPMIEALVTNGYLSMKGKELVPSDSSMVFISVLPEQMKTPDMTAMWGLFNDDVRERKATYNDFIAKMRPWVSKLIVDSAKFFSPTQFGGTARPVTDFKCFGQLGKVGCGSPLRLVPGVAGKYRSFFGCGNPDCKKTFLEAQGKPVERQPVAAEPAAADRVDCPICRKGYLRQVPRRNGEGHFWGCSDWKGGCKATFNDADGRPDLEGKTKGTSAPTQQQDEGQKRYDCQACNAGHLRRIERKDKSGHFWGCSNWQGGCKAILQDADGEPDLDGSTNAGKNWRNGAPPTPTPPRVRTSGNSSRRRPVAPQMYAPKPN